MSLQRFNIAEAYKWWDVLRDGNQLTEIRLLSNDGRTASGIFDNIDNIVEAIAPYTNDWNIYYTINRLPDDVKGLPQYNKIIVRPKQTCNDSMMVARDYVCIDLDSVRLSGTNATDEQIAYTKATANKVYKYLKDVGMNAPVVVFSSNGVHLYLRCAMRNTDENTNLVKRFLKALAMMFSDEHTSVDTSVYNIGRIMRLPSTCSSKGNTMDSTRPQRMCEFVKVPEESNKVNSKEYFEKVASLYPEEEVRPSWHNNYSTQPFDLDAFIAKHNIPVTGKLEVADGTRYYLEHCLFNPQHKNKDAILFRHRSGAVSYYCYHNSCQGNDWRKVRLMYEPDAYSRHSTAIPNNRYKQLPQKEFTPIQQTEEGGKLWLKMSDIAKPKLDVADYIPSGIPQIDNLIIGFKRKHVSLWSGYRGCVDCDTEYFNGVEWKKISDYTEGEKVLQYNLDGTATLVTPKMYHKIPCDSLTWMYNRIKTINQCVCDDHNLVYLSSKGNIVKRNFGELKRRFIKNGRINGHIIPTFAMNNRGIDWSDLEIRLELAISAEAHLFHNRPNRVHRVRINIKHQYKKDELEFLLNALNIPYEKKNYAPKDKDMITYLFYWDKATKLFPVEWYGMSQSQFKVVYDNITIWDGCKIKGGCYRTTEKKNADFAQFCCTSLGYKGHIGRDVRRNKTCYIVIFSARHKRGINLNSDNKKGGCTLTMEEYKTIDGYKYCFTVDSGMLVLRRGDAINITGNCGKSSVLNMLILNAAQNGYKTALWTGELDGTEVKQWLYLQAAGKGYNKKSQFTDFYYTPDNVSDKIDPWINKYLWLFNNEYGENYKQLEYEIRKLKKEEDIDVVMLDSLMVLDYDDIDGDKNEKQKNLMRMLTRLAKELNIHIHLVCHPNKSGTFLRVNNISGSGHIPDYAQYIFILHRLGLDFTKNAQDFLSPSDIGDIVSSGCSNCIEICKCRDKGTAVDKFIHLYYEVESNRLKNDVAEYVHYNWEEPEAEQASFTMDESFYESEWGMPSYEDLGEPPF